MIHNFPNVGAFTCHFRQFCEPNISRIVAEHSSRPIEELVSIGYEHGDKFGISM